MKILFASPDNAVFRIVSQMLMERGHLVERQGSSEITDIVAGYSQNDFLFLNHKTSVNRRVIETTEDRSRIVDLSLAKTPMKRYSGQLISLSVLVVPPEGDKRAESRIILVDDISRENAQSTVHDLLGNVNLVTKTAEENDKIVSEVLVKPYLMALLSRKIADLDYTQPTGEYNLVLELARLITNYNVDQIRDLLRNNPHTGEIVANFEENVKRVWNELSNY